MFLATEARLEKLGKSKSMKFDEKADGVYMSETFFLHKMEDTRYGRFE